MGHQQSINRGQSLDASRVIILVRAMVGEGASLQSWHASHKIKMGPYLLIGLVGFPTLAISINFLAHTVGMSSSSIIENIF